MVSSTEEADGIINICARSRCRKAATIQCRACHKAPDGEGGHVETVWYCGADCQISDWKFHKYDCCKIQTRRFLYRVAETAKLAFFRLIERTFDLDVVGIEEKGDTLYVREGLKNPSIFNPFPAEHLDSDQDKQAVMAWMHCGGSEDYVQVLVETMLQGVAFESAEVQISKVKYRRRVVVSEPNGHEKDSAKSEYVVFKITINEDEIYALDITGAQFGFYDPLTPWASYLENRIETPGRIRRLESLRDGYLARSRKFGQKKDWDNTRKNQNGELAKSFSLAWEAWQVGNGALSAVLKLPEEVFRKKQGELLDLIDERMVAKKNQLQRGQAARNQARQAS